ncbi:lipopolysaccharide biosynthesis protein [Pseudorhizobium endolithicum]|uniref:lipopolysaccharide biosynthesis protein n=1 Tax=Pseudorhizobium endolithicum TaxID=1191678 RepID=UPI001F202AEE|nr:oligosaccharide flippase family protein [Pseudorhizobium endolithicum]
MTGGTATGQLVAFFFAPLITRIYSPEVFGLQGVFLSLISILSPAIALRYPMAIVVAANEADALQLSRLALMIAFLLSCMVALMLAILQEPFLILLGAEALGALVWFLPLALFCVALQDVANYRATRLGSFHLVGTVTAVHSFVTNLARVLGGLLAPVAAVLIFVTSLAPTVQAGLLILGIRRLHGGAVPTHSTARSLALLRMHRDFPCYRVPTDVVGALGQTSPVLLLSQLFSPATAGFYILARSVVGLPLNVVGSAVGNVYYAQFTALAREGNPVFPLAAKSTLLHLALLAGPLLLFSFLFPTLFAFVFGETWRTAGEYAQWMALLVTGMLANIPVVRLLPVIRQQAAHLIFNLLILVGGIFGMLGGRTLYGTAAAAVAGYSVATTALYVLQIITYLLLARWFDKKQPK